jgi:diguanylate cyclase (GGDEF)-like protein
MPTPASPLRALRRLARWAAAGLLAGLLAAGAAAQNLPLRYLTQSDGLANLAVTGLVQMPDGRLWIGTENGLYRHDGARITRIDPGELAMPSRHVSAMAGDGRGGLWVGTAHGIYHLSGDRLAPVDTGGVLVNVRRGQTIAATADGGALVAAVTGLYVVQRGGADGAWRARPALAPAVLAGEASLATIHAVLVDPDGAWWLACGQALCRWQAGALQRSAQSLGQPYWAGLMRARDGTLWLRSQTQVARRAAGATAFEDVTPPGLSQGMVQLHQPLAEDGDGRVMTASDTGLLRWQAGRWERFGAAQGLEVGGGLLALLVDRHEGVWLGTAGMGLAQWRGYRHWRQWTQRQGLPSDDVWSFAEEAPGRMWMGTSDGAALLQREAAIARFQRQADTRNQVGAMARDAAGQFWMSTYSGELFRRRPGGAWQPVADGLPLVLTLRPAVDGGLWLGSEKGLYAVGPSRPQGAPPKVVPVAGGDARQGPPRAVFAACTTPQGRTWFATSIGLLAHDPGQDVTPPEVSGLSASLAITAVACGRDGTVWLASRDERLWRVSGGAQGWRAEAVQPGGILGRRSVMALLADRRGWLWVTTDDGVLVWNGRQWRRFDDSNGLVWNDCNQGSLHEDEAGNIWIGGSRGASQVVAPERLFDAGPVELHVARVARDGQALPHDRPWTADWSPGALQLTWAVPTFTNRPAQQVRYRLRGLSEQWSTTQHDDVSFTALPAGRYTFEAQAENADLGLVSEVVSLHFEILPPWWQSPWALAAYGAAAVALAVLAHRWRVGLLVRRQRELEGLVGQRTAELQVSYEQMRTLALTDGLTGVMNRRAITDLAARELARARRGETPVAFMLLDVDHFKRINDTHGHPAGDAVLAQLVQRLRDAMRDYDTIGRWGGEEFLLVLPGLSLAHQEGRRRAENLRRCVAGQPFDIGTGTPLAVTCSAGVVAVPAGAGETLEAVIARADAALYDAKRGGRDRAVFAA